MFPSNCLSQNITPQEGIHQKLVYVFQLFQFSIWTPERMNETSERMPTTGLFPAKRKLNFRWMVYTAHDLLKLL